MLKILEKKKFKYNVSGGKKKREAWENKFVIANGIYTVVSMGQQKVYNVVI